MSQSKPKILVIDDERDWADSVQMLLQDRYHIDIVETGEEGLRKVKEIDYDMVLMDWQLMGAKSGTDVMVEIKEFNKIIPVILVSGKIDERKPIIEAIHKGIADYVEKDPDLPVELPNAIERQLEHRDRIVTALDRWFRELENPDQVLIRTLSGKEYTGRQIIDEIKKDSPIGRELREGIIRTTLDLILRGKVSV